MRRARPDLATSWPAILAAALTLSNGSAEATQAPAAVPETWRRYAETLVYDVGYAIETADGPAATRLRLTLSSSESSGTPGAAVRIWVDRTGAIARVEAAQALTPDLQTVLVGRTLAEAPPKALAWPITVRLSGKTPAP